MISPLHDKLDETTERVQRIEQKELPAIRDSQQEILIELATIRERQEIQTEIMRKMSEDMEKMKGSR